MNKQQFEIIARKLIKSDLQKEAVSLCLFGNLSAMSAERAIYGKITSTVARDVKRVNEMFDFCEQVHKAGLGL